MSSTNGSNGSNGRPKDPWERQPGETEKAYRAFTIYRDQGPDRTLNAVGEALGHKRGSHGPPTTIEQWSARNGWASRIIAWEDEQDRIRREAQRVELEEATRRHTQALQGALVAMTAPFREVAKRLSEQRLDLSKMDDDELLDLARRTSRAIPQLVTADRLVRGLTTANLEAQVGGLGSDRTEREIDDYLLGFDDGSRHAAANGNGAAPSHQSKEQ